MNKGTRYCGKVMRVGSGSVDVAVVRHSGCASCKVSASCNATEHKTLVVTAIVPEGMSVEVGQSVSVAVPSRNGILSVALGYGLPLFAFVLCCALGYAHTRSDVWGACAGFVADAAYFLLLFLLRGKIAKVFSARLVG